MSTTAFEIVKFDAGYYITMKIKHNKYKHNDDEIIRRFLQIDINSFNNALNLYGWSRQSYGYLNEIYTTHILYFKNKENAELFLKEYLEPQLITKQLSDTI